MVKSSLHHLKINFNKNLTVNGVKPSSFSFGEGQEDEAKNRITSKMLTRAGNPDSYREV
jgi:hypothetical protein